MITKGDLKEVKELAKKHEVRLYFAYNTKRHNYSGVCRRKTNSITIVIPHMKDRAYLLSTFFHELGHVFCRKKGIWYTYHNDIYLTRKNKPILRRTALKAERYVDRWGKKELKKYDKSLLYTNSYYTKYGEEWFRKNVLTRYK